MTKIELNPGFNNRFRELAGLVDDQAETYIGEQLGIPDILKESMLYSLRAGGKRLRPVMIILACEACGGEISKALPAAVAIEMIHTYSLIHDDLPAMDDDDVRRGQPTNHKVFGEGQAILAGDGLLTFAFTVLARYIQDGELCRKLVLELSEGAGIAGMVGGQSADLCGEEKELNVNELEFIHVHKTAKLFESAMKMGAMCAGANDSTVNRLGEFGLTLGLAFQVVDDLLDVTSTSEKMGKQTQKDADAGKMTYPSLLGIEKSRSKSQELKEAAMGYLESANVRHNDLASLAKMLVEREN